MLMLRTIALVVVCILLTASLLKADDKRYRDCCIKIKVFNKHWTRVEVKYTGDAKKMGLDETGLTDYLWLRIKNNFANIRIEYPAVDKAVEEGIDLTEYLKSFNEQSGFVYVKVWVVGDNYPVAYHLVISFYCNNSLLTEWEFLGYGTMDKVPDQIRSQIDKVIQELAIKFSKARVEL